MKHKFGLSRKRAKSFTAPVEATCLSLFLVLMSGGRCCSCQVIWFEHRAARPGMEWNTTTICKVLVYFVASQNCSH